MNCTLMLGRGEEVEEAAENIGLLLTSTRRGSMFEQQSEMVPGQHETYDMLGYEQHVTRVFLASQVEPGPLGGAPSFGRICGPNI